MLQMCMYLGEPLKQVSNCREPHEEYIASYRSHEDAPLHTEDSTDLRRGRSVEAGFRQLLLKPNGLLALLDVLHPGLLESSTSRKSEKKRVQGRISLAKPLLHPEQ